MTRGDSDRNVKSGTPVMSSRSETLAGIPSIEHSMAQKPSTAFQRLKEFITQQMPTSHAYQPIMLKALIEEGGCASLRHIASRFLAQDESRIEYYVEIAKRTAEPALTRQRLMRRDGPGYRLIPDIGDLTSEERSELLRFCDEAVARCNANKPGRDDLRTVRASIQDRSAACIFCDPGDRGIIDHNDLAFALYDGHPVTPLHALVVPRRHAPTYFDLHDPERRAINAILDRVRESLLAADNAIEGFNVGMNCGATAGQTIMHCHVHLIPRRRGDVEQPRGGIRAVIPGKAAY
jgi:diadenosine tetraphosphate (Ap4A) HIT family hydrolase